VEAGGEVSDEAHVGDLHHNPEIVSCVGAGLTVEGPVERPDDIAQVGKDPAEARQRVERQYPVDERDTGRSISGRAGVLTSCFVGAARPRLGGDPEPVVPPRVTGWRVRIRAIDSTHDILLGEGHFHLPRIFQ
jgi:hypothetical protein